MLDKNTFKLLQILNKLITDDSYKVIEKTELLNQFKKGSGLSLGDLQEMITYLQKTEYIDLTYSDPEVYCLAIKPKSRINFEEGFKESKQQVFKINKLLLLYSLLSGVCAFLGTALAIYLFL